MNEINRYNKLNEYYKEKFGERTLKICVDGSFTCPNRDGTKGNGGCIFCSENGSGEHLRKDSIPSQVKKHLESYRGNRADSFIVYFQNFTNTYDTIENLKEKYDSSLIDDRIVGLSVATRPDCINDDIASLLSSYKDKYYVSVELGLQTADDNIGKTINRCYSTKDFIEAVKLLNKYNIEVITHIMIGLPGETQESIDKTIELINSLNISGLKIHSTYIVENTKLYEMYKENRYEPITLEYYIEKACYILTHIRDNIIINRISGDAPKDILVAPSWNSHKKWIMNGIDKYLRENNLYQGMYMKNTTLK